MTDQTEVQTWAHSTFGQVLYQLSYGICQHLSVQTSLNVTFLPYMIFTQEDQHPRFFPQSENNLSESTAPNEMGYRWEK